MVSKGQSPPDQLESNYFHLPLGCLKFILFLAMKIAGVILHPLHRFCVRPGATPAEKKDHSAAQPSNLRWTKQHAKASRGCVCQNLQREAEMH